MAFKMSGFSAFTKTVDPVIGGDSKLYTKNKETILKNGLKDVQIKKYNEILRNPDDYEDITVKTIKDNLKFHKQYLENKKKETKKADKDFLKSQREEPVKRRHLDKKGKELYDKLRNI